MLKEFYKYNRCLFWLSVIAFIIIVIYIVTFDCSELFPRAGLFFNLVFQLSIGYEINILFYYTQIHIPMYRKRRILGACINGRLNRLLSEMEYLFRELNCKYMCNNTFEMSEDDAI